MLHHQKNQTEYFGLIQDSLKFQIIYFPGLEYSLDNPVKEHNKMSLSIEPFDALLHSGMSRTLKVQLVPAKNFLIKYILSLHTVYTRQKKFPLRWRILELCCSGNFFHCSVNFLACTLLYYDYNTS